MNSTRLFIMIGMVALAACGQQHSMAEASTSADDSEAPPPMQGDAAKNPDMTELARQVDADRDGRMTEAEWKAQGLPETSFKGFEKGRGYVTLEDYQKNPAPPGIDLNGDGKLTIAEFKEFDRQMAEKMKTAGKPASGN